MPKFNVHYAISPEETITKTITAHTLEHAKVIACNYDMWPPQFLSYAKMVIVIENTETGGITIIGPMEKNFYK